MPRERPVWRRVLPLALLGLLAGSWVAFQPQGRDARLIAFPIAVLLAALLAWDAARSPRPRPVEEPILRRHEQVVRDVPDPATRAYASALDAYVRDGARVDEAARILGIDPQTLTSASTRRKRETLLRQSLENGDRTS